MIDSGEASGSETELTPIQALYGYYNQGVLRPVDIQAAINYLNPISPDALSDAEEVLGFAESGFRTNPSDPEWSNVHERAQKVYDHRQRINSQRSK